jgi:hypothetical protein
MEQKILTESTRRLFCGWQLNSPVAQLAEQVAVNHWVAGSNPARGVKYHLLISAE